jgi:tetratricopeptide (TPR) repeat protein
LSWRRISTVKAAGLVVLGAVSGAVLGTVALWACALAGPDWLLSDDDQILLLPALWTKQAFGPLLSPGPAPHPAVVGKSGPYSQTAEIEAADLAAALEESRVPGERRKQLLEGYAAVRRNVSSFGAALEGWREESLWRREVPPKPSFPAGVEVPEGFPGEIEDYLRGAVAYHRGEIDAARASWDRLLARPAHERRRRTTWATFMLGRAAVESDPETAVRRLRETRALASQGFPDPLGLAAASLGWEAKAEIKRGRMDDALVLYLEQYKAGDPTALQSLRRASAAALADPRALQRVARSPGARPILTAYMLVNGYSPYEGELAPNEDARLWLAALREAKVSLVEEGDRLAWVAYHAGDFDQAAAWAERAPADAPLALWVRAKLLMRRGRMAEADRLLARAVPKLPLPPSMDDWELWRVAESEPPAANRLRALGELGAVRLQRRDYRAALESLARGGYWTEAAYVGERVLTLEELRSYVDARWPPAGKPDEAWSPLYAGFQNPDDATLSFQLRYLLGRRLVRARRYGDAVPYLPAELREAARELGNTLARARDRHRPVAERAGLLFQAACTVRHQGLELLGTELEPDWAIDNGALDEGSYSTVRADPAQYEVFLPTPEEARRVRRSQAQPGERFHSRFRGAGLAWEAASLLPDGSDEKARILAVAGSWIKYRNPKAADRFYKRLVRCCSNTEMGRLADELRWFPEVEDCAPNPAPTGDSR